MGSRDEFVHMGDGSSGEVIEGEAFEVFDSGSEDFCVGDVEGMDHFVHSQRFFSDGVDADEVGLGIGHCQG